MSDQIREITKRLEKLEKIVFRSTQPLLSSPKSNKSSANSKSLKDYILSLRDKNFFKQPMAAKEVYVKLKSSYSCEPKRVGVELVRLQQKKQLRKASKILGKEKLVAYVW